jgi:hypothetical protein
MTCRSNYYLGNANHNQINTIFLRICEFLQEVHQVILKNNTTSNGLDKKGSSILIDRKSGKNIPGVEINFC